MSPRSRFGALSFVLLALVLSGCGGRSSAVMPAPAGAAAPSALHAPQSLPLPPPMATGAPLPSSAMTAGATDERAPMQAAALRAAATSRSTQTVSLTWSYIPAAATHVTYGADGSLYALSTGPAGPDKSIWHLVGNQWVNLPGYAQQIAGASDGSLWAVTSTGGLYRYAGGSWSSIAGGVGQFAVDNSGNVYAVGYGGTGDQPIWQRKNGSWSWTGGYGTSVASYPDGSLYVLTSWGAVYHAVTGGASFALCPGYVSSLAPLASAAGFYALAYSATLGSTGAWLWQYTSSRAGDCTSGSYQLTNGYGTSLAVSGNQVALVGTNAVIYTTTIAAATASPSPSPAPVGGGQQGPGTALNGPKSTTSLGWTPTDVANTFQFPVQSGWDGTGTTVAIIDASGLNSNDFSAYVAYQHTPTTNRAINLVSIDGASTGPSASASSLGETTLDIETVLGLAPGANVKIYVTGDLAWQHVNDALNAIISDGTAKVISMSFGGCESYDAASSAIFAKAASAGIAAIASSGDQGSACFYGTNTYRTGVDYPASDVNVIGVGGTETIPGAYALGSTTVWNDDWFSGHKQGASGGGVSQEFAIPSFQQGFGGASSSYRNVPDLALPAVGTAVYLNGQWVQYGGTSWSAPTFAAMLAEIFQYCTRSLSAPASIPYVAAQRGTTFTDVVAGNNGYGLSTGSTTAYGAGRGYDNASGIGIPLGMPIAQSLCPNRVPQLAAVRAVASARPPASPRRVDAAPRVVGLQSLGRRSASAPTRIQLVLIDGPTIADDEHTVQSVLIAAGLTIERTFTNHFVIDASGPASAVEQLFATQLDDYTQELYGARYAPGGSATIPAQLAPYVAGVVLDDVVAAQHHGRRDPPAIGL